MQQHMDDLHSLGSLHADPGCADAAAVEDDATAAIARRFGVACLQVEDWECWHHYWQLHHSEIVPARTVRLKQILDLTNMVFFKNTLKMPIKLSK